MARRHATRPTPPRSERPLLLDYAGNVDDNLLRLLELHARATGLSLEQLDLLGSDATAALRFIDAAEEGDVTAFLDTVDWTALAAGTAGAPAV